MVEVNNKTMTIAVAAIILLILIVVLIVRSSVNAERADAAKRMSVVLLQTLQEQQYQRLYPRCRALTAGDYAGIEACLRQAKESKEIDAMFEEEAFKNFDIKRNATGYLLIRNARGGKSFASEKFALSRNNVQIAQGCATSGELTEGMVCRFELTSFCAPGDNLEVLYEGRRAHLKTC